MSTRNMRVFISYSRENAAVTHLLSYILGEHGVQCEMDDQLVPGRRFDAGIQAMIRRADVVIVLLTNASASSIWVNQEIGFALALGKPIWPICTEREITPEGMLEGIEWFSLIDWSDVSGTVNRLVNTLRRAAEVPETEDHYQDLRLDQVIQGKEERTRFIIRKLGALIAQPERRLDVCAQAAFSTFAVSDDVDYRAAGHHSPEYMRLLVEERNLLEELVRRHQTRFRMIVWPVRAYERKYLAIRYRNLITWLESVRGHGNVTVAYGEYLGSNRLIVSGDPGGDYCIEGYKLHHTAGYEMTIARYNPGAIEDAVSEFERAFRQAECSLDEVIRILRERLDGIV